jgi:hypothetical protein
MPSTAEVGHVTPQGATFIKRMSKRVGGGVPTHRCRSIVSRPCLRGSLQDAAEGWLELGQNNINIALWLLHHEARRFS